jgi:glycine/D-amino acid oxidase-like deaminating enzyme
MTTVIIGGGIIGAATAYYLTNDTSPNRDQEVHVIESSSQPFSGASGYAGGFLSKDWFSPAVAPLGALSFELHKELAAEHGGDRKWGYMQSTALSLEVSDASARGAKGRGDDWLREGTSRAEVAKDSTWTVMDDAPAWLTRQVGGRVEKISDEDSAAQV